MKPSSTTPQRLTIRVVAFDPDNRVDDIREQEIPYTEHQVKLLLRRAPFSELIAKVMLNGGRIAIESKERK